VGKENFEFFFIFVFLFDAAGGEWRWTKGVDLNLEETVGRIFGSLLRN
jgi:hypothetical protein